MLKSHRPGTSGTRPRMAPHRNYWTVYAARIVSPYSILTHTNHQPRGTTDFLVLGLRTPCSSSQIGRHFINDLFIFRRCYLMCALASPQGISLTRAMHVWPHFATYAIWHVAATARLPRGCTELPEQSWAEILFVVFNWAVASSLIRFAKGNDRIGWCTRLWFPKMHGQPYRSLSVPKAPVITQSLNCTLFKLVSDHYDGLSSVDNLLLAKALSWNLESY